MNKVLAGKHEQTGSSLVEMSMTIMVFIVLIMAIIEFSLLIFFWARGVEATRAGARYAAVNSPVTDISGLNCSEDDTTVITTDCSGEACAGLLQNMRHIMPTLEGEHVRISYSCGRVGNPERPEEMIIPEITVSITGVEFHFMSAGLFGVDGGVTMPDFTAARTGEDMYSPDIE